jgi:hypothetical protein
MLRRDLIAVAVIALLTDPAFADLQGISTGAPTFTRDEIIIINRNATLSELSKYNPWIVRKFLDAIEKAASGKSLSPPPPSPGGNEADPDMDRMQRASPEAVHDLFQLLKQAGDKKPDKPK